MTGLDALAEKWLLEYFVLAGPRRPGDLEDDFCGVPGLFELELNPQGRWRSSPFFLALTRLVEKGTIRWWKDDGGDVWYAPQNRRPGQDPQGASRRGRIVPCGAGVHILPS